VLPPLESHQVIPPSEHSELQSANHLIDYANAGVTKGFMSDILYNVIGENSVAKMLWRDTVTLGPPPHYLRRGSLSAQREIGSRVVGFV
jgi:hypothetical protein